MRKIDLETPSLLIDRERLTRNLKEMQRIANEAGVALRPHTKTHKCPELAKLQLAEGASGICVQKLSEAEAMVGSGIRDIFITNEIVEPTKIDRLVKIQEKATVKVAVDSLNVAESIGKSAASVGQTVPVLIEVDTGMRRCGVPLGSASVNMARQIARISGIRFEGLMTYDGQLYRTAKKRRGTVAKRTVRKLVENAKRVRKAGVEVPVVSCGSTPTAADVVQVPGVTEVQPGNYVFYDLWQVRLGSATKDRLALRVLATVISKPQPTGAVLDAGIKAFSHDKCKFPEPLNLSGAKAVAIYEEHLQLRINPKTELNIGDKVEFLPYHACTAANMHSKAHVVENNEVVATWPIVARG